LVILCGDIYNAKLWAVMIKLSNSIYR